VKLALAGDTMLGRKVGEALASVPPQALVAEEVVAIAREADVFVLNLESCISARGRPWPDPRKPFFFRAPPNAVETLVHLGVDCVTLANNHAFDFGEEALLDTFELLETAGIAWVGAGSDLERARGPVVLEAHGFRLAVLGFADHPAEYAAGERTPGIAHLDLGEERLPAWLVDAIREADAHATLVTPHWGPNMTPSPVAAVRVAAGRLLEAGATLVAGHSAHVFQGVAGPVLYDLGDFLDDYAVDRALRNDLGLLFIVTLDWEGPERLEAVPLKLDYCFTRLAEGEEAAWIRRRFREACAAFGTEVAEAGGRLAVDLSAGRRRRAG
jgi:poly-gamma-glutamate capsule biosynthesis protein CapA/YwtB (metallophosphatase superfamily)